jgi:hypothetical protein
MAKYGTGSKYGAIKYGNQSLITTTTTAYKTQQAKIVRNLYSQIVINSFFKQYGNLVNYPQSETLKIGGIHLNAVAQAFVCPKAVTISAIEFMAKGAAGNTAQIYARLYSYPAMTLLAEKLCPAVTSIMQKWVRATFNSTVSLSAGLTYWLVLVTDDSNTNTYYIAGDDKGTNDSPAYQADEPGQWGTFKWGDGTKYGATFSSEWVATNYMILVRLISSVTAENDQIISDIVSWKLVRNRDISAYQFMVSLANINYKYSLGQPYYDLLNSGKQIKAYIGYNVSS